MSRRVVVTGLGIISPVGNSVDAAWGSVLDSISGIRMIDSFDTSLYPSKFAGLVQNFEPTDYISKKDVKKSDTFIHYGIAAASQAVEDAGLDKNESLDLDKIGVSMGSGIGGIGTIQEYSNIVAEKGPKRISPFFIPATIVNMISGNLSIKYGFRGPNIAVSTACTTSTHSIGLSYRAIQTNDADIMICGGAESASTPLGMGGFAAAKALSTRNDAPEKASRPWDIDRDGFVLGDGSACLVLEEYEHAKRRGAKIYAEVIGFGYNGDAFHITRPSGTGAKKCLEKAIADAKINPEQIGYVNAHATSTIAGDIDESLAIRDVVGENHLSKVSVSSTKSMTGHLLGAAGAIEALFSVLALRDQILPPTINLDNIDPKCDFLDYVPNIAKEKKIEISVSNSFGFGGTNGTLIFKKHS